MANIIVVDGPEAAGKSTLIRRLWADAPFRRWGPVDSINEYRLRLNVDFQRPDSLVVWDRSWASEVVYDRLLKRGRWNADFELERQYLEGHAVLKIMVLTPPMVLQERRKARIAGGETGDLPVSPWLEYNEFRKYAAENNWAVMKGNM